MSKLESLEKIARKLQADRCVIRDRSAAMRDARQIARENEELMARLRQQCELACK